MTDFLRPMRPQHLPRRIDTPPVPMPVPARAPQDVDTDLDVECWYCRTTWPARLLTSSGAGPCCVLDHDDHGDVRVA